MFFDSVHPRGVVEKMLTCHYTTRWFAQAAATIPEAWFLQMGKAGGKHLRFIGQCVPSRVHLANIRLHFNGWHTQARYQQRTGSTCLFCNGRDSEDSIEHIVRCPVVQSFLPTSFKKGRPPRTPVKYFYLFGLDNKHKIAMALFIFGLYSMHNELRHNPNRTDLRQCTFRIAGEVRLSGQMKKVWEEVFGWRIGS